MKTKILTGVILVAIIGLVTFQVQTTKKEIWTSRDGETKLVTCNPSPRKTSKLWGLRDTWRPATKEELELHKEKLPKDRVILAGAGMLTIESIAESGCYIPGIGETGSYFRRTYPPRSDDWQLLVKKAAPIKGRLPEGTNRIGIFPIR